MIEVEVVEIERERVDGKPRFRFKANNYDSRDENQPFPQYPISLSLTAPDARYSIGDKLEVKVSKKN